MLTGGAVGGTAVGDGVGGAVGDGDGGGAVGVGGGAVGDGVGGTAVGVGGAAVGVGVVCAKLVAPPKDSMATIAIMTTAIDRVIRITWYSLYLRESQHSTPLTETG